MKRIAKIGVAVCFVGVAQAAGKVSLTLAFRKGTVIVVR